jgi:outer membrane receptor for ferric coprogen and ferric-rhodotorulic acid
MKACHSSRHIMAGTILCSIALGTSAFAAEDHPAQKDEAKQLENIEVTAPRLRREDTDGSKSYTSSAVTVAGKTPLAPREIPNSVSVITRQQMDDQSMATITDALNQATGVNVFSNDITQSQYYARGYALESQADGSPSSMAMSGYQQFDLDIYDRIEVFRGPAGLLQGSGAPSGTVNMVRKRPRDTFAVSGALSAGSWDFYRGTLDVTGPLLKTLPLRGRLVLSGQDRNFYFDRAESQKWLGYGVLEYDVTRRTTLTASYTYQDDKSSSFSGPPAWADGRYITMRNLNPYPDWARTIWTTREMAASLEHRFDSKWVATARVTKRDQRFFFKDAYPTTGVDVAALTATYARREYDYNYDNLSAEAYASGPFNLFGHTHNLLFGYNYGSFKSANQGAKLATNVTGVTVFDLGPNITTEPTIAYTSGGESTTVQSGYYGQVRYKLLEPLTLVVGGRLTDFDADTRSVPPSAPTDWKQGAKANSEFTLQGGVVYDVTKNISTYFSYSDIFVPQTNLKSDGSMIDPRTGRQYEIGVKGEFFEGQLNANCAVFRIRDENRAITDAANPTFWVNGGEFESKGFETEIAGRPAPGWDISTGYTFLETKMLKANSGEGDPINFWFPKHSFKLWTKYSFAGGALGGLSLGGGVQAYSKSVQNGPTPTVTVPNIREQEAYAVVNLQAGYQFTKNISAIVNVNNLFDEAYHTRIGGLGTYNTYGDPRNIMVTLRASY